jgi:hypothetical protein
MIKDRRRYELKAASGFGCLVESTEAFGEDMQPVTDAELRAMPVVTSAPQEPATDASPDAAPVGNRRRTDPGYVPPSDAEPDPDRTVTEQPRELYDPLTVIRIRPTRCMVRELTAEIYRSDLLSPEIQALDYENATGVSVTEELNGYSVWILTLRGAHFREFFPMDKDALAGAIELAVMIAFRRIPI